MAYLFPSAEWTEQLENAINSSDTYAAAAKTWEGDFIFVIEEGGGIYMDLWHGKCRGSAFLEDPSSRDSEFKVTAPMEKWQRVFAKKLDPIQGLVTRQLKLDGNLVKIMKSVKAAQELVKCATTIDTVYE